MNDCERTRTYDCPSCGASTLLEWTGRWRAKCLGCGELGPAGRGDEDAAIRWNRMVGSEGRKIARERGITFNEEHIATMRRFERVPTGPLD